ncbi:subtilisin-like protease SBT5.4 [Corylus avellana]|uniref:subtilisin-like protease SBT5.4 n=1 Tax=Corylus avellana TaxID=13451 RepID=UPI00286CD698|nr:subtilisin-like protease SBT5.4 [Corylus avellana]
MKGMGLSILSPFLLSFVLFSLSHTPSIAAKKSYIVYMGGHSHLLEPSSADLDSVTNSHYDLLGTVLGGAEKARDSIFYSYTRNINGFAANLNEEEAAEIGKNPNVVSVFENLPRQLHTTRSWDFLGLSDGVPGGSGLWKSARFGEDTIIGNLDTGVWPESKSFSDEGLGPIPSKWRGVCDQGYKNGLQCNKKLIGARYFNQGFSAGTNIHLNESFNTARDFDGHGSHTLSTAGGNFVAGANVFGIGNGTAKGGSPKARVAAYKVCWTAENISSCYDADLLAAFEAAITDGVDVLSVSIGGGPSEFANEAISIGSFHAVKKGIVVVCSGGNSGPSPGTITNVAPWIFTVAASTLDREFANTVALGNKLNFTGTSLSGALTPANFYPVISAADARAANTSPEDALLCPAGGLDPVKVKGKILVCLRGINARLDKGRQALLAGAVGMILANDKITGNEIISDAHVIPASHINYTDGLQLFAYINSTENATAYISPVQTVLGTKPAPSMASFSSRGPSLVEPTILKPDITAPGVNILAAYSEGTSPTDEDSDKRRVPFNIDSGTSMSCPHISGIAGLLKTLHPDWSPAAIKSAIMTTAKIRDDKKQGILDLANNAPATPLAYGAGHVQPSHAADPGLIYDLTVNDYLNFLCSFGYNETIIKVFAGEPYTCPTSFNMADFNYPTIAVPNLFQNESTVIVTRTVTNVGAPTSSYQVRVREPDAVSIVVDPPTLNFKAVGEKQTFKVTLKPLGRGAQRYVFGEMVWSDGTHNVRSPIVVE